MAMVVVDASCLKQADSQPKSCSLVWGSAAAWRCSTFTRWTEWTLAMTWSWWQHYKYRRGYYYYYYYYYYYVYTYQISSLYVKRFGRKEGPRNFGDDGMGAWWPLETCFPSPILSCQFRLFWVKPCQPNCGDRVNNWPLASRLLTSLKVIGTDTNLSATYDFLLVFHSNTGAISCRFRDKGIYLQNPPPRI